MSDSGTNNTLVCVCACAHRDGDGDLWEALGVWQALSDCCARAARPFELDPVLRVEVLTGGELNEHSFRAQVHNTATATRLPVVEPGGETPVGCVVVLVGGGGSRPEQPRTSLVHLFEFMSNTPPSRASHTYFPEGGCRMLVALGLTSVGVPFSRMIPAGVPAPPLLPTSARAAETAPFFLAYMRTPARFLRCLLGSDAVGAQWCALSCRSYRRADAQVGCDARIVLTDKMPRAAYQWLLDSPRLMAPVGCSGDMSVTDAITAGILPTLLGETIYGEKHRTMLDYALLFERWAAQSVTEQHPETIAAIDAILSFARAGSANEEPATEDAPPPPWFDDALRAANTAVARQLVRDFSLHLRQTRALDVPGVLDMVFAAHAHHTNRRAAAVCA